MPVKGDVYVTYVGDIPHFHTSTGRNLKVWPEQV
jgi:hypothetical protein